MIEIVEKLNVMDIDNLLNTKNHYAASTSPLDLSKAPSTVLGTRPHWPLLPSPRSSLDSKRAGPDKNDPTAVMTQHPPTTLQQPPPYSPSSSGYPEHVAYQSQINLSEPSSSTSQLPYDPIEQRNKANAQQAGDAAHLQTNGHSNGENDLPKAFACSTCHKGFARRSDLVRHGTLPQSSCHCIFCGLMICARADP